jgi:hypothetical protein
MVKSIICVNHLVRPSIDVTVKGTGNCTTCVPDEENYKCKNFSPVTFFVDMYEGDKNE